MRAIPLTILMAALLLGPAASLAGAGADQAPEAAPAAIDEAVAPGEDEVMSLRWLPPPTRKALYEAQVRRGKGEFAEAARELASYLRDNPDRDHHLVRFHLGTYLLAAGRPREALAELGQAVALEPRSHAAWLSLAETAYEQEDYPRAAEAFGETFRRRPGAEPRLLYYAAAAYLLGGRPESALPLLEELVGGAHGEPALDWYRALVSAALEAKQPERAEAIVPDLLRHHGDDPEAWFLRFQFDAARGDYESAAVMLTITGYMRPLTATEHRQLGDILAAVGAPYASAGCYRLALGAASGLREAVRSAAGGTAVAGAAGAVAAASAEAAALQEKLASAYLAAHEPEAAERILDEAIAASPTVRLWSLLGDVNYVQGDFGPALNAYQQVRTLDPANGRAYLMIGFCALKEGDLDTAAANLEIAAGYPDQEKTAKALLKRTRREGAG